MFFLQTTSSSGVSIVLFLGTLGMVVLTVSLIIFIILHQRRVLRFQNKINQMEQEQQKILLNASIKLQEEERQRLAADLHDDAGPLLATARLYLNENLVNQDTATQLQSIFQARQIIDDTIQLVRNISHSLMPPTLKNFGLESAVNDLFQKISGSGSINASSRFHEYKDRLKGEKELVIFRIVQELINNIIKHSGAEQIAINVFQLGEKMQFSLTHDGTGIAKEEHAGLLTKKGAIGLKNIENRLKFIGGTIEFTKRNTNEFNTAIVVPL